MDLEAKLGSMHKLSHCATSASAQFLKVNEALQVQVADIQQQLAEAQAECSAAKALCAATEGHFRMACKRIGAMQQELEEATDQQEALQQSVGELQRDLSALLPEDPQQLAAMLQQRIQTSVAGASISDGGVDAVLDPSNPNVQPLSVPGRQSLPGMPELKHLVADNLVTKVTPMRMAMDTAATGSGSSSSSSDHSTSSSGQPDGGYHRTFGMAAAEPYFYMHINQQAPGMRLVPQLHAVGVRPCAGGSDPQSMQLVVIVDKGLGDLMDCLALDLEGLAASGMQQGQLRRAVVALVAWYAHSVLRVVSAINAMGIIMDDIKPSQFILSADCTCVQAIDLEALRRASAQHPDYGHYVDGPITFGTDGFFAPERCMGAASRSSEKSDAYAVAVTLRDLTAFANATLTDAGLPDGMASTSALDMLCQRARWMTRRRGRPCRG